MLKPTQLQQKLIERVPLLTQSPEKLTITVGSGQIISTLAGGLSFEYHFPLTLKINDLKDGDPMQDLVVVTVLAWLRENQPDLLANNNKRQTGFSWALENTDQQNILTLTLQLTERVQVLEEDGNAMITHLPEPPQPENVSPFYQVYLNKELISRWTV